jgi:hypothetical protein
MKCHYLVSIHLPDSVLNYPDASEEVRSAMAATLRDFIPTIMPSISAETWWNVQVVKNGAEASEAYDMHEGIASTPEAEKIAAAQRYDPHQPFPRVCSACGKVVNTIRDAGEHLCDGCEAPAAGPVVFRFVTDRQQPLFRTALHLARFMWLIVKALRDD